MSYLSALRPSERRLVVVTGSVFFVILNLWLVVPHFSDWGKTRIRMGAAQTKLAKWQKDIHMIPTYERRIREMESAGAQVPIEDQAMHFDSAVQSQADTSGINILQKGRNVSKTNQFFIEQSQPLSILAREQQLVDFLFLLGGGSSLIRVRDLTLQADATHQQLNANIKLVASYQKKPPAKTAPVAAAPVKKAPAVAPAKASPTASPNPTKLPVLPGSKPGQTPPGTKTPPPPAKNVNPTPKKP
jgi:hypothetical protein